MIKPKCLKEGDHVAIVSLSSGMLGEHYCAHYIELGQRRLNQLGLKPVFMPNALKGVDYLRKHPEARATDLKQAFADDTIKGIICAIGGDDTYRTLKYLLEDQDFKALVIKKPKLFTGFSDTTINHLMFYQLGLVTYYGPNYINDFSEMAGCMLTYTEQAIKNYYLAENIFAPITASDTWYEERTDFSIKALGSSRISHTEQRGFQLLQGQYPFSGKLLGGCLESLSDLISGSRFADEAVVNHKYGIFPTAEQWQGKILFIETSEENPSPKRYYDHLMQLKEQGVFANVNGILHGKPQNENYYDEYKQIICEMVDDNTLPIVYNVNFGHAYPRTVLAYGVKVNVTVDGIYYSEPCINKKEIVK